MRSPRLRRPSPALAVAVLALFAALGGSAYAVRQISGTTIKPRSIPGDRIRNNALTGTQINEARLGRVNEAKNANNSKFALRASAADSSANALNAANARNAAALGGNPAGAFQTRVRWALVGSTGAVLAQSGGVGNAVHTGTGTYVLDLGASLTGKALLVTPNGASATTAAAAPCGGGTGGVSCSVSNDANHAQIQLGANSAFYISVIG